MAGHSSKQFEYKNGDAREAVKKIFSLKRQKFIDALKFQLLLLIFSCSAFIFSIIKISTQSKKKNLKICIISNANNKFLRNTIPTGFFTSGNAFFDFIFLKTFETFQIDLLKFGPFLTKIFERDYCSFFFSSLTLSITPKMYLKD